MEALEFMPPTLITTRYVVPLEIEEMTVRQYLRQVLGISHSLWKRIKVSETFRLNGDVARMTMASVHGGDVLTWQLPAPPAWKPLPLPLDVIYEDEALLIVNKPARQLSHPTAKEREGSLRDAVLYHFQQQHENAGFYLAHRLDRNTSGLVLIAKRPEVQHLLFHNGKTFERAYFAITTGHIEPACGIIDLPIGRAEGSIIKREVRGDGKRAVTRYRVLTANDQASFLYLTLLTGRTHQIRVHLSHLGHPLLGDDLYGGSRALLERQALHAGALRLTHPLTHEPIYAHAPLPVDMQEVLKKLSLVPQKSLGLFL